MAHTGAAIKYSNAIIRFKGARKLRYERNVVDLTVQF